MAIQFTPISGETPLPQQLRLGRRIHRARNLTHSLDAEQPLVDQNLATLSGAIRYIRAMARQAEKLHGNLSVVAFKETGGTDQLGLARKQNRLPFPNLLGSRRMAAEINYWHRALPREDEARIGLEVLAGLVEKVPLAPEPEIVWTLTVPDHPSSHQKVAALKTLGFMPIAEPQAFPLADGMERVSRQLWAREV